MPQPILLNDILRLPTRDHAGIKAKFNKRNKNVDPIDSYLADPKTWTGALKLRTTSMTKIT